MEEKKDWVFIGLAGVLIVLTLAAGDSVNFNFRSSDDQPSLDSPSSSRRGGNIDVNTVPAGRQDRVIGGPDILVIRVIDGDTIEIEGSQRVRYLGMDTPETVDPRRPVQCFGKEASAKNKELVEGKYVRLEKDITEADKYGRLLRYVYVDDKLINLELVRDGFAVILTLPPDVKYTDQFLAAQQEARQAKRGLWGKCLTL